MASKLETPTIVPLDTQESKLFHFFQVYMLLIIYIVLILVIIITLNKWEIFYFLQNWYFAKDTWMLSFCHCHAQSSSPCTLCLARFFLYSLMSSDSFFSSPHFWLFLILKLCIEVPSRLVIPITLSTRFFLYHHFLLFVEQIFHLGSI